MLKIMIDSKTGRLRRIPLVIIVALVAFIFATAILLNQKNTKDLTAITEESISDELVSASMAAVAMIDVDAFAQYMSEEDTKKDAANYTATLSKLRRLQTGIKAEYIYALKKINGEWNFVFDTDTEDEAIFIPYEVPEELAEAIALASRGEATTVLNIEDEYGYFNTGVVPIYQNGEVVGIMCTDIDAHLLQNSKEAASRNGIILAVSMAVVLGLLLAFLFYLLRKVKEMQLQLHNQANNDIITGLPNRRYLFEYLNEHMDIQPQMPFALVFIDLDNFKKVNDLAGHDAGDELLRKIGDFLNNEGRNAMTFHPSAGYLNVSCRVGGDEFVMIYPGASTEEHAAKIAESILEAFVPEKISPLAEKYNVSLSVGIALYPHHSENYHAVIKYADAAMYQAKKSGKNQYRIYADGMQGENEGNR